MKYEPISSDSYFHIYNRGNNKENIFKEERNYSYFLNLMDKYLTDVCEIYAYCLLPNHFHLILKTKSDIDSKIISQKFSNLFNTYSKAINKAYNRSGSLFKDRFSRKRIDTEEYIKQLVLYVHLNPQHHKILNDFRQYRHSSYQSYLSNRQSKLDRAYILSLFDSKSNFEYEHLYKKRILDTKFILE